MKIHVSKESVVYQGPAYEDSYWGQVQFPEILNCANGALAIKIHAADDNWAEFGKNQDVWCVSTDKGVTWERTDRALTSEVGHLLPSGDRLYFPLVTGLTCKTADLKPARIVTQRLPSDKIVKEKDGSWPYPAFMYRDIWGAANYIYDQETLPDEYAKKEWSGYRIKKGEPQGGEEKVKVIIPICLFAVLYGEKTLLWHPSAPTGADFARIKRATFG